MQFRRYVVAVAIFVLFVGGAFTIYAAADAAEDSAAQEPDEVVNESINQQVDIWQFVDKATVDSTAGFNESVTVYNSSGTELTKGDDYLWNASSGTINYQNTASVTDGATGNITYTYFENTEDVKALDSVIDPLVTFVGNAPILLAGFGFIIVFLVIAGIVNKYVFRDDMKTNR